MSTVERGETAPKQYTAEHISRLMVASYRFSQGGTGLQKAILRELVYDHGKDFDEPTVTAAKKLADTVIYRVVDSDQHIDTSVTRAAIRNDISKNLDIPLDKHLYDLEQGTLKTEPSEVAILMWQRDESLPVNNVRSYGGIGG